MTNGHNRLRRIRSCQSCREARQRLDELADHAKADGEQTILTRNGEPIAALISIHELRHFEKLQDADDLAYLAWDEAHPEGPNIPLAQVKEELARERERRKAE